MTLLEDNHAGAMYNYLISVQTGHRKNAGTSANVNATDATTTTTKTLCFLRIFCANFHGHTHTDLPVAQVTARLLGSEGESDTHNLIDPNKPVFERGAVDVFLLTAPFPLGEVRNLRLQHDNSGGGPSWYCNQGKASKHCSTLAENRKTQDKKTSLHCSACV